MGTNNYAHVARRGRRHPAPADVGTGHPGTDSSAFPSAVFAGWSQVFYARLRAHMARASAAMGACGADPDRAKALANAPCQQQDSHWDGISRRPRAPGLAEKDGFLTGVVCLAL
jgi:hypothetical protein